MAVVIKWVYNITLEKMKTRTAQAVTTEEHSRDKRIRHECITEENTPARNNKTAKREVTQNSANEGFPPNTHHKISYGEKRK